MTPRLPINPGRCARGGHQTDETPMKRGHYKVIRTDGTETVHQGALSVPDICRLIGCDMLDTVTIDRLRETVMFVDDAGMIEGKPVNPKATALYHRVCKPGTLHQIHGTAVILNGRDIASFPATEE